MKTFKFSAIIVAIAFVFGGATADAQMFSKDATRTFKPSKEAKKEAKKMEKEGWGVSFGAMSMPEQIQRSYYFTNEIDNEGNAKYAIGHGRSTAQYYDAARLQAMQVARLDIAQQIETQLVAEAENVFGNEEGANAVTSVMQSTTGGRSYVSQCLKQTIIVTEIQRELPNGNKEVQVRIAADRASVLDAAKKAISEDLKKRGGDIVNRLKESGWDT